MRVITTILMAIFAISCTNNSGIALLNNDDFKTTVDGKDVALWVESLKFFESWKNVQDG